jgi:hypothetical protein
MFAHARDFFNAIGRTLTCSRGIFKHSARRDGSGAEPGRLSFEPDFRPTLPDHLVDKPRSDDVLPGSIPLGWNPGFSDQVPVCLCMCEVDVEGLMLFCFGCRILTLRRFFVFRWLECPRPMWLSFGPDRRIRSLRLWRSRGSRFGRGITSWVCLDLNVSQLLAWSPSGRHLSLRDPFNINLIERWLSDL